MRRARLTIRARLQEPNTRFLRFCSLVWFLSRLTFDNDTFFKFTLSLINYLALTLSSFIYGKHMNLQSRTILCGIFLMCFIPYIFTMSMQLLRQFTAGSILVLLVVLKSYTKISPYWIYAGALSMVLIHLLLILSDIQGRLRHIVCIF